MTEGQRIFLIIVGVIAAAWLLFVLWFSGYEW
jgi:hypothetical protein